MSAIDQCEPQVIDALRKSGWIVREQPYPIRRIGEKGYVYPHREDTAGVVVLARLAGDFIIIEEDTTDRKLVDSLLQQGISREQIILAYEGEAVSESS